MPRKADKSAARAQKEAAERAESRGTDFTNKCRRLNPGKSQDGSLSLNRRLLRLPSPGERERGRAALAQSGPREPREIDNLPDAAAVVHDRRLPPISREGGRTSPDSDENSPLFLDPGRFGAALRRAGKLPGQLIKACPSESPGVIFFLGGIMTAAECEWKFGEVRSCV